MRVLQFGRFWNDQHGGTERHAALLCRGLAQRGVDVVNLVAAQGSASSDQPYDGYRLVQAASFGVFARTAMSPALLYKALAMHRAQPFHVIHLHMPDPLSHLASLLMPSEIKRVVSWHFDITRQKRMLALYQPFLSRELARADAVVVATQAHFDESTQMPAQLTQARRHVIPYGLDYSAMTLTASGEALRDRLRAPAQGRAIIFALGRHVYYKGFEVLVRAMRELDAYLILGGGGPLNASLRQQAAQLGLGDDRISFSGRIPEDDLAAYYHACDIFALPSVERTEAFGLVQLEAMACGKPVVCSQLGNGVNIVNQEGVTGLAVPPGDPAALAAGLRRLIDDPSHPARLGAQARSRALNQYSLETMSASMVDLYRSLL